MNPLEKLLHLRDLDIGFNCDLKHYSTMKLKARGDLVIVKSISSLKRLLMELNKDSLGYRILGMGSNQLLPEKSSVPYIKLDLPFLKSYLNHPRDVYTFPASVHLGLLSNHASRFGLTGWEVFTGVPATLGGAVFMNAGTNLGEIGTLVRKIRLVDCRGEEKEIVTSDESFAYRKNNFTVPGDIIFEIEMSHGGRDEKKVSTVIKSHLKKRNETQPIRARTCGCVFKNETPCSAGHYIDIMGLKGLSYNSMRTSHIHGNFVENMGDACYSDAVCLIQNVKKELLLHFGIDFETEIKV